MVEPMNGLAELERLLAKVMALAEENDTLLPVYVARCLDRVEELRSRTSKH